MIGWVIVSHSSSMWTLIIYLPNMCYRTETIKYNFDTLFVCYTLYIFMPTWIFGKILHFLESVILCTFRKCILSYTSIVHFLRFRSLHEKRCIQQKIAHVTQMGPNLKNMTNRVFLHCRPYWTLHAVEILQKIILHCSPEMYCLKDSTVSSHRKKEEHFLTLNYA